MRASSKTVAVLLFVLVPAPLLLAQRGALDRLEGLAERYRSFAHYRDRGTVVVTELAPETAPRRARYRLETVRSGDRFLLHLAGEDREILVFRDDDGSRIWDRQQGERPVATPTSGLADLLGWGDGTTDLLLVHFLLAEPEAGLDLPAAAAVEGPVPCGARSCDVLILSRLGGAMETRLLVDVDAGLVRSASTRALSTGDVLARAMADAGLPSRRSGGESVLLEMELDEVSLEPPPAPPVFAPPSSNEVVGHAAAASPHHDLLPSTDPRDRVFADSILVREVTVTARVLDRGNRPVRDLRPEDFRARIGRREVKVRAVDWVSSEEPPGWDIPPEVRAKYDIVVDPPGKLVVIFVQADLEPTRGKGHLRMLPETRKLVQSFHRDDQVAVVSFDSHLKLRQDFTRQHERIPDALSRAIRFGKAEPPEPGPYPSLGRFMEPRELRRVATPERALEVTAEALSHFPGEKVVIFLGWGLGRFGAGGVRMTPDYEPAREALARANATVFVLDVTQADYHSLEIGLQQVAADTGGTYERGYQGPQLARKRLAATISGYYLLTIEVPSDLTDARRLRIELTGAKGHVVMAPKEVGPRR